MRFIHTLLGPPRLLSSSPDANRWDKLASWVVRHRLSSPNVRWMIQVPRLYHLYRRAGDIQSMDEMLQNIFRPLFEVTLDPASHADLHVFLRQMAGIDSVDDESVRETPTAANEVPADEWTHAENPPFVYWMCVRDRDCERRAKTQTSRLALVFVIRIRFFIAARHHSS